MCALGTSARVNRVVNRAPSWTDTLRSPRAMTANRYRLTCGSSIPFRNRTLIVSPTWYSP